MIKVKPHSCVEQLIVSDLIVCGDSYLTRAALLCDMKPYEQTQSDTISCSTHTHVAFLFLQNATLTFQHLPRLPDGTSLPVSLWSAATGVPEGGTGGKLDAALPGDARLIRPRPAGRPRARGPHTVQDGRLRACVLCEVRTEDAV